MASSAPLADRIAQFRVMGDSHVFIITASADGRGCALHLPVPPAADAAQCAADVLARLRVFYGNARVAVAVTTSGWVAPAWFDATVDGSAASDLFARLRETDPGTLVATTVLPEGVIFTRNFPGAFEFV
jgi:hypothetical protein